MKKKHFSKYQILRLLETVLYKIFHSMMAFTLFTKKKILEILFSALKLKLKVR